MPSALLFGAAVGVLFLAHLVRATRHSFLFPKADFAGRFDLLLALSLGHAVNTLIPLHLGEVLRVLFITVRLRWRPSYVAATVTAERLSDVIAVAVLMAAISTVSPAAASVIAPLAITAVVVLLGIAGVRRSRRVRRTVWRVASIFNEPIRQAVLEYVWTTAQLVREGQLWTARYLIATVGMWALYLGAFKLFALWVGLSLSEVSLALLGEPLRSLVVEIQRGSLSRPTIAFLVFTSVPVAVVLIYGLLRRREEISRALAVARRFGFGAMPMETRPISHRFRDTKDYATFLGAHFTTTNQIVSRFAVGGMDDVVVHRLLPGGSDAITAVVEVNGTLGIRKFATADAGEKLLVQANWLREQRASLPLPEVVGERRYAGQYHYDMPYVLTARDFYDVIHTAPIQVGLTVLGDVVNDMGCFHARHAQGNATAEVVDAYLAKKALANAQEVLAYARAVIGEEYTINGDAYSLREWDRLLDMDWLRQQIERTETAVIHGDLTVENIIVCPERPRGWYLIDPNPDNVLNTPLIDWAKLMQSLHLGYEGLNRSGAATVQGEAVRLAFTRSSAYAELHRHLTTLLHSRLGPGGVREVSFHELVNYLRLTPYKIRRDSTKGLTFFACTSILLQRYIQEHNA